MHGAIAEDAQAGAGIQLLSKHDTDESAAVGADCIRELLQASLFAHAVRSYSYDFTTMGKQPGIERMTGLQTDRACKALLQ
mgnify:CR=1 FL=1